MISYTAMIKKLWNYAFGTVFRRGASILTIFTFGSYGLGLIRDILFARTFGAGELLDVYNAAFIIPDLLLNIFVAGALTAAFIPIFTHLWSTDEEKEAEKVATTMLTSAPLMIIIIGIAAFIFMPQLAEEVAPKFNSEQKELLIEMSRILLISPVLFAISNTLAGMQISYERFAGYGFSLLLYNVGIITGIPLTKIFGPHGLVVGVITGASLVLIARIIDISRSKFKPAFPPDFKNKNFLQILRLMVPRMAGQPVEQLTFFIFTRLASFFAAGSITMLSYARNFQSVPVSIFGIAFSTAVFSSLSRKAAQEYKDGFLYHFWETAKPLAILSGLSAVFFFFFGELVIDIFFGGGEFGPEKVHKTGTLLATFAFAIPAECFIHLLARAFYALKDTWTPLLITLPGLVLIWFIAKLFMPIFGLVALPLSFAIILTAEVAILFLILWRKLQKMKNISKREKL